MATCTASDANENGAVTDGPAAETADGGGLSLREAVILANADANADGIAFDACPAGATIALDQGKLVLSTDVSIDGDLDGDGAPDVALEAQGASGALAITAGTSASRGITVTGGDQTGRGGGLRVDAGATLLFSDGAIVGNRADEGGGIFDDGAVVLTSVVASGNAAIIDGGAFFDEGAMTTTDVTVMGDRSDDDGGRIDNPYGALTASRTERGRLRGGLRLRGGRCGRDLPRLPVAGVRPPRARGHARRAGRDRDAGGVHHGHRLRGRRHEPDPGDHADRRDARARRGAGRHPGRRRAGRDPGRRGRRPPLRARRGRHPPRQGGRRPGARQQWRRPRAG